jgi:membrane-bound ClpP family serine protease
LDLGETFDLDGDFDGDMDGDLGFLGLSLPLHLISIRGIIGFIMMFGWSGLAFSLANIGSIWSFIFAFLTGLLMMLVIALIYYGISKLNEDGNVAVADAIGKTCEVYLVIPSKGNGMGKVTIMMNGSLKEYDAISLDEAISSGERAEVVDVINDKLVVIKMEKTK